MYYTFRFRVVAILALYFLRKALIEKKKLHIIILHFKCNSSGQCNDRAVTCEHLIDLVTPGMNVTPLEAAQTLYLHLILSQCSAW